tara:strand:- start:586 stop:867 length:282 start_codon:yes stop_codon:yes gene_type:complete
MPTKKELQEKIKKLEEQNNELNADLGRSAEIMFDLHQFLKMLKLWDIYVKNSEEKKLDLEEVKQAVNTICPCWMEEHNAKTGKDIYDEACGNK